jgi:hypothetical protein
MSQPVPLRRGRSRRLARKLAAYLAAGVVAEVASPCDAGIIYQTFDPPTSLFGALDLNADGRSDFVFDADFGTDTWGCEFTSSGFTYCHTWAGSRRWFVVEGQAQDGNALLGRDRNGTPLGHALPAGAFIDITAATLDRAILVRSSSTDSGGTFGCDPGCTNFAGYFLPEGRAYLGIIFEDSSSNRHVGWIGIETDDFLNLSMFGYGYEIVPGRSIAAGAVPEPPSLVLLAAGAAGLALLRKKRARHGRR